MNFENQIENAGPLVVAKVWRLSITIDINFDDNFNLCIRNAIIFYGFGQIYVYTISAWFRQL